jgi:nucleotide-binding universal stress UspA family protein
MKILVPYDFTPITRVALDHAIFYADLADAKIELLHIVEKESQSKQAEEKFSELMETLMPEVKDLIQPKVMVGNIFKDITKAAKDGNFQLLVMGTHGEKGLQKLFGSNAIKVITSGHLPFIVTQSKGPVESIQRIVLPVNLTKESLQIIDFAAAAAKRFDAEIHIIYEEESDEWLNKKIKINIAHAHNQLEKAKVKHIVKGLKVEDSFSEEVVRYGAVVGADLFAVAHFSESILPQFDRFSQQMITNPLQAPVLILNATDVGWVKGHYTFIRT